MALFDWIFQIFSKRAPDKMLEDLYADIHAISSELRETAAELTELQRKLTLHQDPSKTDKPTGKLARGKTLFIEETEEDLKQYDFLRRIAALESATEKRFFAVTDQLASTQPQGFIERQELGKIKLLLDQIKDTLPAPESLAKKPANAALARITNTLRAVTKIAKAFHDRELLEEKVKTEVQQHMLSDLLKKVYNNAEAHAGSTLLKFTLTQEELDKIVEETERINECDDPSFSIKWRHWWRGKQVCEIDATTPLKEPHVNVDITLAGATKALHIIVQD